MKNLSKDTQIRAFMALFLLIIIISLFQNCKKTPTAPDIPQFGSIRVESLPTGAKVYLDGLDTGRTTNCILSDISTGSHYVKLVLEGYRDVEQTVTVSAGGTFPVNINFVGHSIMITKPAEESIVIIGDEYEIKWETDNSINLNEYSGTFNSNKC
jgi:hypothetical protein